ncbi:MAG: DUF2935 domain-containing protein [Brevibacillus sp.]|nr:DUF2935 domain-containing protein [Brevibacillus sp.]
MQYYYGDKMPLRILDEAEFWKQQEAEHTVVIRELVPDLEPQFTDALQNWEQAFSQTQALVVRYVETLVRSGNLLQPAFYQRMLGLIQHCLQQSQQFIQFLNQLAEQSEPIRRSPVVIVVLNHIRRESEYFIGIAQTILYQSPAHPLVYC